MYTGIADKEFRDYLMTKEQHSHIYYQRGRRRGEGERGTDQGREGGRERGREGDGCLIIVMAYNRQYMCCVKRHSVYNSFYIVSIIALIIIMIKAVSVTRESQ